MPPSLKGTKKQKRQQLERLLKRYTTMVDVANHFGISRQRVHQMLKQYGVPFDAAKSKERLMQKKRKELRKQKKELFEKARRLYEAGHTMTEIGLELFGHKVNPNNKTKPSRVCYVQVYHLFSLFGYQKEQISFRVNGEALRQARLNKGLRQSDIGVVGPMRIINLEKGGYGARRETIEALSRKLEVPFESLATLRRYKPSKPKR